MRIILQRIMFHSIIQSFIDNYNLVMTGTFTQELIEVSEVKNLRECLKKISEKYLFSNNEVISKEIMGGKIISELVALYGNGLFNVETDNITISFDKRIMAMISSDYLEVFRKTINCAKDCKGIEINSNNIYYILLLIADQISGMTDTYCLSLYRKLNAI